MTIASVDTSRDAWTNCIAAQIWEHMCCHVWHCAQRDLMPLLQKTFLGVDNGWWVREIEGKMTGSR